MCGCVVDCVEFAAMTIKTQEIYFIQKKTVCATNKKSKQKLRSDGQKQSL